MYCTRNTPQYNNVLQTVLPVQCFVTDLNDAKNVFKPYSNKALVVECIVPYKEK